MSTDSTYDPTYDTLTGAPIASQAIGTALEAPPVLGWALHIGLCGVMLANFVQYVQAGRYKRDSTQVKIAIWTVVFVDVSIAGINLWELVYWGSTQDRSTAHLTSATWPDTMPAMLSAVVGVIVQGFFVNRAFRLITSKLWAYVWLGLVALTMVLAFAAGVLTSALNMAQITGTYDNMAPLTFANVPVVWLWASAAVDVTTTSTLCFLLLRQVAGFNKATDGALRKLMRLAITTASYTAFISVFAGLSLVVTDPNSILQANISFAFWPLLPALYAISLFTTLAARDRISAGMRADLVDETYGSGAPTGTAGRRTVGLMPSGYLPSQSFQSGMISVLASGPLANDPGNDKRKDDPDRKKSEDSEV